MYEYLNISALSSPLSIVDARNTLMAHFLDQTTATHIWWIDTDMGFHSNTVERLLAHDLDVVGALTYRMQMNGPDGMGGYRTDTHPVAFDMTINTEEEGYTDINGNHIAYYTPKHDLDLESVTPIKVAATGTGCLLVSRDAAEKVRSQFGNSWFDQVRYNTRAKMWLSEDLSFCYRLATVGISIYIDPKVKTNHQKTVWI